jgi:hypothetical protein
MLCNKLLPNSRATAFSHESLSDFGVGWTNIGCGEALHQVVGVAGLTWEALLACVHLGPEWIATSGQASLGALEGVQRASAATEALLRSALGLYTVTSVHIPLVEASHVTNL